MLTPLETVSLIVLCLLLLLVVGNTLIPVAWAESADPAAPSEEDSVVVLPTLVVLFTQSDLKTATQQDIAAFHGQMAAIKEFFIQEGGQHIELELDYLQIDRPLALAEFGSPGTDAIICMVTTRSPSCGKVASILHTTPSSSPSGRGGPK